MIAIMAAGVFSLACVLWHVMGMARTGLFLVMLGFGYWQSSADFGRDSEWGLLVIDLVLSVLLITLAGVWNFIRFIMLLINSLILLYVLKSVYHHIDSLAAVILVSFCAVAITGTFFLSVVRNNDLSRPNKHAR